MNKYGVDEATFNDWLQHPVTEAYREFLRGQIDDRKEIVAGGCCTIDSKGFSDIGQKYLHQINVISTYESMLEDIQQYQIILPDEEQVNGESEEGIGKSDSN